MGIELDVEVAKLRGWTLWECELGQWVLEPWGDALKSVDPQYKLEKVSWDKLDWDRFHSERVPEYSTNPDAFLVLLNELRPVCMVGVENWYVNTEMGETLGEAICKAWIVR